MSPAQGKCLKDLGVVVLYLFGSRAQGIARATSDYDFGVLLDDPSRIRDGSQELYQQIYEILEGSVKGRVNLDIVFLDRASLQLRYHVLQYGKVLLDADPKRRGAFEEQALEEHADFEPFRRLFEATTLERIA